LIDHGTETSGGLGVAIDSSGNIWTATATAKSLAEFSGTGSIVNGSYIGGGLSTPTAPAIDSSDRV
jgi:hypothetical protein